MAGSIMKSPPRQITRSPHRQITSTPGDPSLHIWHLPAADFVNADDVRRFEALGAGEGDVLVLIDAIAAHADAADHVAVLVQRNAAGELDDARLEQAAVGVADVPERPTG